MSAVQVGREVQREPSPFPFSICPEEPTAARSVALVTTREREQSLHICWLANLPILAANPGWHFAPPSVLSRSTGRGS